MPSNQTIADDALNNELIKKIPYSIKVVLPIWVAVEVLVFSLGFAAAAYINGLSSPASILLNQFSHWDSLHYLNIAQYGYVFHGYQQDFIVFFPLYPALIRLTTFDFAYANLSALLISNVSSLVAAVYLFKLARLDFEHNNAKKAVLYFLVFPTAYFLSAIYTEGLFLALTITSFYYARSGKWPIAGVLSMLAALTRLGGLLLLPALLVEYGSQKKWNLRAFDKRFLWVFLALGGFLIYLFINYQVAGNPFAYMEVYKNNWSLTVNPVAGLQRAVQWSISAPFPDNMYTIAELAFAGFGLFAVCAGFWMRFRPSYNVYMLLSWALAVSSSWWMSVPRYMLAMFPMFILIGVMPQTKPMHYAITAAFGTLLCFFTVLFAMNQFVF